MSSSSSTPSFDEQWSPEEDPTAEEAEALLARRRLRHFIRYAWPILEPGTPLTWNWHIDAICEHLEAVTNGQIHHLLINIPPGFAKSLIVSVLWPAWLWAKRPEWRGLFASYAQDLSLRDSTRCRTVVESAWYQRYFAWKWRLKSDSEAEADWDPEDLAAWKEDWGLAPDQNAKSYFANTKQGFRLAMSVGGRTTGFRGDGIIVDDPLNATEAYSKLAREKVIDWWDNAMATRLNDVRTGFKVVIMQRLHEEDLSGHILRTGGYEHLCLPMEYEPKRRCVTSIWEDPRKEAGELLFPEKVPAESLKTEKAKTATWAGQFQQTPVVDSGNIFQRDWWQTYSLDPLEMAKSCDEVIQSWDCAFKGTESSDYVVGQVWGRRGAQFYLLDQKRDRMSFIGTKQAIRELTTKWPQARAKLIEDKANGPAIISELGAEVGGLIAVDPGKDDKPSRARAISPYVQAKNVFLPEKVSWRSDFVEECAAFPRSTNDDQVDAMSQALNHFATQYEFKAPEPVIDVTSSGSSYWNA